MPDDDDRTRELFEQVSAALQGLTGQGRPVSWFEMQARVRILCNVDPVVGHAFEAVLRERQREVN